MTRVTCSRHCSAGSTTASAANSFSPTSPTRSACVKVQDLLGDPIVTPYDVFRSYRDQNERVSAKLVEVPVEKFLAEVAEPSPEEVKAEYESTRTCSPIPAARPLDSRSHARSRSRSCRSTATPWPAASRTS